MISEIVSVILKFVGVFFFVYLLIYASYLFLSVAVGAWRLYSYDKMRSVKNELKHEFYFPVSILVPAHNLKGIDTSRATIRIVEVARVEDAFRNLFNPS